MGYQSRKRNYKSPRERLQLHWRNISVGVIFLLIALVVLIIQHGNEIWYWLETYSF